MHGFETVDWLVVGVDFVLMFGIAIYAGFQRTGDTASSNFFLAGRNESRPIGRTDHTSLTEKSANW